jgi:hypothetical protein
MQQYAINSNMMRSEYQINSTLTEQAHQARMIEIDRAQAAQNWRHTTPTADALLRQDQFDRGLAWEQEQFNRELAWEQEQYDAEMNFPQLPNHLVTPYRELTARQDVALNAVDVLDRAIEASRDPQLFRGGELKGKEQALIADIERLAIQDARIANGGAEPNTEQIERAMERYGYDPARRRWTGNATAQEERLKGLRDRWMRDLQDTERQFGELGIGGYRSPDRRDTVTKRLRSEREKAAEAAGNQGISVDQ